MSNHSESSTQYPKACGCNHITDNGGSTCSQMGNSYRCGNCLRQDRDTAVNNALAITEHWGQALVQRDEARTLAREFFWGERPISPGSGEWDDGLPGWLQAENEEGE